MKQIPILSGKAMTVELPEGAKDLDIFKAHYGQQLMYTDRFNCGFTIDLPDGNWQIVGMLSEVTEAQCRELVDEAESGYRGHFPNSTFVYKGRAFGMSSFGHAWKALASAIFALGYVFDDPNEGDYDLGVFETQSRVLDRSRCLLLGREDG